MLQKRIIPVLLFKNSGLVKTIKFKNPTYVGDPINAVKIFNEKEVDELVFLDITATLENRKPPFERIEQIASECFMPLCYGGGIRNINDIRRIFNIGVEKVSINSYAVENPLFISQAAEIFGSQSIIVAIDVKKNIFGNCEVRTQSGNKSSKIDPVEFAIRMEKMGAGEIMLNSIDQDGTMSGFDINLIKRVTAAVNIPVIACGGAGKLEDFDEVFKNGGASAAAAGSYFVFQGKHRAVLINYLSADEIRRIA